MNNQPIGVLDSGVGGLSIWKEIVRELPLESTIYAADSRNCPYGAKSSQAIYHLAKRLVQFLVQQQVKLIVLACNTMTVSCLDKLREDFPQLPLIGTVPVVKTAAEKTKGGKIGILSTTKTAESKYQKQLLQTYAADCVVINIGTNKLVPFVEKGEVRGQALEKVLRKELEVFKKEDIDVLALGCSHFPFLKDTMQQILGNDVQILDSGEAIARQVKRVLEKIDGLSNSKSTSQRLYTTGDEKQFEKTAQTLMGYNMKWKIGHKVL